MNELFTDSFDTIKEDCKRDMVPSPSKFDSGVCSNELYLVICKFDIHDTKATEVRVCTPYFEAGKDGSEWVTFSEVDSDAIHYVPQCVAYEKDYVSLAIRWARLSVVKEKAPGLLQLLNLDDVIVAKPGVTHVPYQ